MFMKLLLSALAFIAASAALGTPAQAQNYPWCALYSGGGAGGGTNCGFVSFAQCMATAMQGLGGFCISEYAIRTAAGSASATALSISPLSRAPAARCGEAAKFPRRARR